MQDLSTLTSVDRDAIEARARALRAQMIRRGISSFWRKVGKPDTRPVAQPSN